MGRIDLPDVYRDEDRTDRYDSEEGHENRVRSWLRETFLRPAVEEPEPERIVLPPEPMFRDPMGGDWEAL
jgi:hypothetical protein